MPKPDWIRVKAAIPTGRFRETKDIVRTHQLVTVCEEALPAHPGKSRLLHVHRNVPGVLAEIDRVFSDRHINIAAQYLQTRADVGYVVIDIDAEHSDLALAKLADAAGTLRSRILFLTGRNHDVRVFGQGRRSDLSRAQCDGLPRRQSEVDPRRLEVKSHRP